MTYGRASTPGDVPRGPKASDPGARIGQIGDRLRRRTRERTVRVYAPAVPGSRGINFIDVPHDRRPIMAPWSLDRNGRPSRAVGAGPECPLPALLQGAPLRTNGPMRDFISVSREKRVRVLSLFRWLVCAYLTAHGDQSSAHSCLSGRPSST